MRQPRRAGVVEVGEGALLQFSRARPAELAIRPRDVRTANDTIGLLVLHWVGRAGMVDRSPADQLDPAARTRESRPSHGWPARASRRCWQSEGRGELPHAAPRGPRQAAVENQPLTPPSDDY